MPAGFPFKTVQYKKKQKCYLSKNYLPNAFARRIQTLRAFSALLFCVHKVFKIQFSDLKNTKCR